MPDSLPRSSRRSRVPKRYLDDDYTPTQSVAAKRNRSSTPATPLAATPVKNSRSSRKSTTATQQATVSSASASAPPPAKKPRRNTRASQKAVVEKIYEEADSESEDSEDLDFPEPNFDDFEAEDEILEGFSDVSAGKNVAENDQDQEIYPWIDLPAEEIPKLELPESSADIPLPRNLIFDAIEAYEILRSHHRTLRLTPFLFEDFCGALISQNNSCLMAEIHIALLKVALKSDDEEGVHYSVNDTNNAINLILHHLDPLTYGEILRLYIEAYPGVDESVLEAVNAPNYPFVGFEPKLVVILFMCYRFLYSSEYRKVVSNSGGFKNEESCRVCGKSSARIVGCSRCEASFHPECSSLKPFPEVLICNLCTQNAAVKGVQDARHFDECIEKEPLRMSPIGRDRHGRVYWFVARRVFVQSEDESTEIHYYSTVPQLYQLLESLDEKFYEKSLCAFFRKNIDEFLEQMTQTFELSGERIEQIVKEKVARKVYFEQLPEMYLQQDNVKRMSSILYSCRQIAYLKQEAEMAVKKEEAAENPVENPPKILSETLLGIHDARLVNTFWSCGVQEEALIDLYVQNHGDAQILAEKFWRMGDAKCDDRFMLYKNFYAQNEMSEGFHARKKTQDRKKYMFSKFSFHEDANFQFDWTIPREKSTIFGPEMILEKILACTIQKFARKLPLALMHRKWRKNLAPFEQKLAESRNFADFAQRLLEFEMAIRKTVFVPQYYNGIGQTRFERSTVEQRDLAAKEFQRAKKLEVDAIQKELDDSFVRVNYRKPKWPNTYLMRQKGEFYRNAGKGGMGGWYWISAKRPQKLGDVPKKPSLKEQEAKVLDEEQQKSNRKASNLLKITEKLGKLAEAREKRRKFDENPELGKSYKFSTCYASKCAGKSGNSNFSCYSPNCRTKYWEKVEAAEKRAELRRNRVVGQELMWDIPEVQTFGSKSDRKKRNLFILQKKILRKLCKTGGCQQIYLPGFSLAGKSNPSVWNYPAPRPCFDLCWKWQLLNAKSLHAVSLALKILWTTIRWSEMDPDDTHPDRRVVVDHPTHDERRKVIWHHEMGPFGQYERYLMEIEIIPLYNDDLFDEEDDAWSAKKEREGKKTGKSTRKSRGFSDKAAISGSATRRVPKEIKKVWFDGVDLKLYEIRDYWKLVIKGEEDEERRLAPPPPPRKFAAPGSATAAAKKQADYFNKHPVGSVGATLVHSMAQFRALHSNAGKTRNSVGQPMHPSHHLHPSQLAARIGPPPMPQPRRPPQAPPTNNGNLPKLAPRQTFAPPKMIPQTHPQIRNSYPLQHPQDYRFSQQPSTSRAAAGRDSLPLPQPPAAATVAYRNVQLAPRPIQAMRQTSNGYQFAEGAIRGGGRNGNPQPQPQPTTIIRKVYYKTVEPVGEPHQTPEMRRMVVQQPKNPGLAGEEAIGANNASDGDEPPPIIPRYDQQPPIRHVYQQQTQRIIPQAAPGGKGPVIVIKRAANDPGTNVVIRQAIPSGGRIVQVRNAAPSAGGARVMRIQPGGLAPQRAFVTPNTQMIQKARIVPRGGTTMQMAQQQLETNDLQPEEEQIQQEF